MDRSFALHASIVAGSVTRVPRPRTLTAVNPATPAAMRAFLVAPVFFIRTTAMISFIVFPSQARGAFRDGVDLIDRGNKDLAIPERAFLPGLCNRQDHLDDPVLCILRDDHQDQGLGDLVIDH